MPSSEIHKMVSKMNKKDSNYAKDQTICEIQSTVGTASVLFTSLHINSWNNLIEENIVWGRVLDFCAVVEYH